jgi:glutaminase
MSSWIENEASSMQDKSTDNTLYAELERWAQDRGLSADAAIEQVLAHFYPVAIADKRLARFFEGVDLKALREHQSRFMQAVFSGQPDGGLTDKYLFEAHEQLIRQKGLKTVHFDVFWEIFLGALRAQDLPSTFIARVHTHLDPFREVFDAAVTRYAGDRESRLFFALDVDGDGTVPESDIRDALKDSGLGEQDDRLAALYGNLNANAGRPLRLNAFSRIVGNAGLLVERALQGGLAIPDFADFKKRVGELFDEVLKNTDGEQADYIPPLAEVDPERFGVAIVTVDGQVCTAGHDDVDFSIQSMCKPFNYCFAIEELGAAEVHRHVGTEPSGRAFNDRDLMARLRSTASDSRPERVEIPFNPMINAGAIMTAALVKQREGFADRLRHVREQWARLAGIVPDHSGSIPETTLPRFNKEMARQENYTGYNNLALGYLLMATGMLPHLPRQIPMDELPDDPTDFAFLYEPAIAEALKLYFGTCSLEMNVREMATAAATLANGGVCPMTQERVLAQSTVRSCLSVTQMCGMYDGSGEFFYDIGLPAKSGVGGGVILVVPKLMGICVFSPRLNAQGNSVRGVEFARRLVQHFRLHLYDGVMTDGSRIDPRVPLARWRAAQSSEALWAASKGDLRTLTRLYEEQVDLATGDYDLRTPMHLAAAEGHVDVVEFLLNRGLRPVPDRWGGLPISDATNNDHAAVVELFQRLGMTGAPPQHFVSNVSGLTDRAADHGDDLAVVELLWAAAENNVYGLRRLVAQGVPVHAQDYDRRTALHLAASEGHLEAARYLVAHGHPLHVRDRWHATPIDEADREGRVEVAEYLRSITS